MCIPCISPRGAFVWRAAHGGGWENEAGGGRLPEGLERRGERLSHGYIRAQDEDRELIRERERRY